jgi:hypothetical protein
MAFARVRWSLHQLATRFIHSVGTWHTFAYLSISYLLIAIAGSYLMQNPRPPKPNGCAHSIGIISMGSAVAWATRT